MKRLAIGGAALLMLVGCTSPNPGPADGGFDAGPPPIDPCADVPSEWRAELHPSPPTRCDDRNGGCDTRARCDDSAGSIRCTCASEFAGDGWECHPPGWTFVDQAPPYLVGVAYDACRDRFIGQSIDATSLWTFDPASSEPTRFRRVPTDRPFEVLNDVPGAWSRSRLRLVGRRLLVPGLTVLPTAEEWRNSRVATFTFDVDTGRRWEDARLEDIADLCLDGPGRLLGFGDKRVVEVDAETFTVTALTLPVADTGASACFDAAPGGRALLVIKEDDGARLSFATRDDTGGWQVTPSTPPRPGSSWSAVRSARHEGGGLFVGTLAWSSTGSIGALFELAPETQPTSWRPIDLGPDEREAIGWLARDSRRARTFVGLSSFHVDPAQVANRQHERIGVVRAGDAALTPAAENKRFTPPTLGESMVAFEASRRVLYEWGGESQMDAGRGRTEALRRFPLATGRWEIVAETGDVPFPRLNAASAFDTSLDRILVFGGHAPFGPAPSNALLELKVNPAGTAATWRTVPTSGDGPPALSGSIVTIEDDTLWLFGGVHVQTNGRNMESITGRSNGAWRLRLDEEPAAWERVDDGTLPSLGFADGYKGEASVTRGLRVPGLELVAAGSTDLVHGRNTALYSVTLTVPPVATTLALPDGLSIASSRIGFDSHRSRLIHLSNGVTHAIPVSDGVLGPPERLCAVGGRGMEWSFPLPEGLLAGPYRMDGHVRLLDATTPACPP